MNYDCWANINHIRPIGFERHDDHVLTLPGLNAWIIENVKDKDCHYAEWGGHRPGNYLAGIYLYPEQATLFKLKFNI